MSRNLVVGLAATLLLAGCPLPQPLPDYPAGTVTPPRILAASTTRGVESLIPVPAGCATEPTLDLDATIFYQDTVTVEARWFVDYKTTEPSRYAIQNTSGITAVPPDPDPTVLTRAVPRFHFRPYGYPVPDELAGGLDRQAPGVVHVVELVVSNGFDASADVPEPNRTPAHTSTGQFEIQTYRWTFVNVAPNATVTCP
ncbi:hypothetical protein [Anaeromyxobacter oryzae]|uniref:Lipoprotein n=1 Tax=Anaeromyxobacter oryzae TaxID=2918170 RepID=A0ABN6N3S0_9BACT|nr:hypothetical protein [Anaeromyxobacter oryzae]BDG06584.1 hypothetical protein AMOR_55800 [Anaeromyxobacter oryzae]